MTSKSLLVAPLFALLALAACSSNSTPAGGGGGGSTSLYCSTTTAGVSSCYGYTNLSSAQQSAESTACTDQSGTVVSSCPTASLIGCCNATTAGYNTETCYYGTAAATSDSGTAAEDSGVAAVDAGSLASSYQSSCTATAGSTWSTTP